MGLKTPYGQLRIAHVPREVRNIWYSKDSELEPVEFYQLCDREWQDPSKVDDQIDNHAIVDMLLDKLTLRERNLVFMLFSQDLSIKEISKKWRITQRRVCQIWHKALRKLKYWVSVVSVFEKAMREYQQQQRKNWQESPI